MTPLNEYTCQGCGYVLLAAEESLVFGADEDHSSQAVGYSELDKSNVSIGHHARKS
jgi:hypothetical protein